MPWLQNLLKQRDEDHWWRGCLSSGQGGSDKGDHDVMHCEVRFKISEKDIAHVSGKIEALKELVDRDIARDVGWVEDVSTKESPVLRVEPEDWQREINAAHIMDGH